MSTAMAHFNGHAAADLAEAPPTAAADEAVQPLPASDPLHGLMLAAMKRTYQMFADREGAPPPP